MQFKRLLALGLVSTCLVPVGAAELQFSSQFSAQVGQALHPVSLAHDSEMKLFSTLANGATCGNSGFEVLDAQGCTVVRSGFAACSATEARGPWSLKAGGYQLKLWHNGSGGSYAAKLVTETSTYANDVEPNDPAASATSLLLNQAAYGHLGYYDGVSTDHSDIYSLTLYEEGALKLDLTADASLSRGGRGVGISLSLPDGTTVRDLTRLAPGRYIVNVYADTYYEQAYGGYSLLPQFIPTATPPVTNVGGHVQSSNVGLNDRYVVLQSVFTPTATDVSEGGNRNVYLAAHFQGKFFFFVRVDDYNYTLSPYTEGEPAAYTSVPVAELGGRTWTLGLFDVSSLVPPGFDLYAGFGSSLSDMLNRNQVRLAHRVN